MRDRILEGALNVFKARGLKFTMDDLAAELSMSKKTIYTVFDDKNQLLCDMVDYAFDRIKEEEDLIYNNESLSLVDKIRGILGVLPDGYANFDIESLYQFKDKYPRAYAVLSVRLESGWEKTRELFEAGQKQGLLRKFDFDIFQVAYESSIERLIMSDVLEKKNIAYSEAFKELVNILVDGIIA